jgi:hypothetical protein
MTFSGFIAARCSAAKPGASITKAQSIADAMLAIMKITNGISKTPAISGIMPRTGPTKRPKKHAPDTPLAEEFFAALVTARIARQRPYLHRTIFQLVADPIGDHVAAERAGDRARPDGPEGNVGRSDQCADRHQNHRCRHEEADDRERLAECQQERDGSGAQAPRPRSSSQMKGTAE